MFSVYDLKISFSTDLPQIYKTKQIHWYNLKSKNQISRVKYKQGKCVNHYTKKLSLHRTRGFQEAETPRVFRQQTHEDDNVVSATHRSPLPLGKVHRTHLCYRLSQTQDHRIAERIKTMKRVKGLIGYRTRILPDCSAVPHRTALPRTKFMF